MKSNKYHLILEDFDTRVHPADDGESWEEVQTEVKKYLRGTQAACLQILNSGSYEQYNGTEEK